MSNELSTSMSTELPDYMKDTDANLGNENVSSSDIRVPTVSLLQALSPELKKDHVKHIPGAEPGKIAIGKEFFDSVNLINLYYEKEWTIFDVNRQFVGTFKSEQAASDYLSIHGLDANANRIVETAKHACLHCDENGDILGPAVVLMSNTKLRVSNQWNTEIVKANLPRFGVIWKLGVVEETNAKGSFYNFTIDRAGYPSEATFREAQDNYESINKPQMAA